MTLKRSAILLVVFATLELLHRKKPDILAHGSFTSFLCRAIANKDPAPWRTSNHSRSEITRLKQDIQQYQHREEQRDSELLGLKDSLREALSQQAALLQSLREGTALVMGLTAGMEERDKEIKAKTAEIQSLVEILKQEGARNGEIEGRLLVPVAREIMGELECQLDLMRRSLTSNNIFITGLQAKIDNLEDNDTPAYEITPSMQADEELEVSVRSAQESVGEISTLKQKIEEHEDELEAKDALISDLSRHVDSLTTRKAKGGDVPVDDAAKEVEEREDGEEHAIKSKELNSSLDFMRDMLNEKDLAGKELERKIEQMDGDLAEKERRIRSLLKVNRKQEDRLAEMEGRVLALTSTYENLAGMRSRDKERFENDIYKLRQSLADTKESATKVHERVEELEAEATVKDEKLKSLSQVERDLKAQVAKRDKTIAKLAAATAPTSPARVQKPTRSQQEALPDMQTVTHYEQKIAELTDKLAECHGRLKACPSNPTWPPPYEIATTSNHDNARAVATSSPARFCSAPSLDAPERFSMPQ